jgi:hypothetical protein
LLRTHSVDLGNSQREHFCFLNDRMLKMAQL